MTRAYRGWFAPLAALALLAAPTGCKKDDEGKDDQAGRQKPGTDTEEPGTGETPPGQPSMIPKPSQLPNTWPEPVIPEDNPTTEEKVALGHMLFFDTRLSADGSRACYSCHQNEHGNGGEIPLAVGAKEKQLTRHSPVIWNAGLWKAFYWDGRAPTLEAQAIGAWSGGNMGVGKENLEAKAKEIAKIKGYKDAFAAAFPDEGVTPDTIAKALSAYERTLECKDTAYDKYAGGDESALTDEQKEGLGVFMGKGQCMICHTPPTFSVAMAAPEGAVYYNVGIGTDVEDPEQVDVGRMAVSEAEADWAAFKVPSLRNVSKSAPYFHNGSVETLEEAVALMASGGIDNKNKVQLIADRNLTDEEVQALVAFLGALECGELEEPELPE